jgi:hypothetical protein
MAGKCYNLAYAAKCISQCTTAGAEHLKQNMTYALHPYKNSDYATLKRMIWAVFYHHFGIHNTRREWCRWLQNKDKPEELKKLYYRCKVKNAKLYQQLFDIWEVYCTDVSLKEVHHSWHTNECESMNQFITKYIQKPFHLCRTIIGQAHTYLAVSLDSRRYEEYYQMLFQLLNLDYDETIMCRHHKFQDKQKIRKMSNTKLPAV